MLTVTPLASLASSIHPVQVEVRVFAEHRTEHRVLDGRQIFEAETWPHVGVAGKLVVVREQEALAVYRWSDNAVKKPEAGR